MLTGRGQTRWELGKQLVLAWPKMLSVASDTKRPFVYLVSRRGVLSAVKI